MTLYKKSMMELSDLYRAREISPVDVVRTLLDEIDQENQKRNAFVFLDRDGAMAQAVLSEKRWADGNPFGSFDGVPVSIKDLLDVKGWPTLKGSKTIDPNQTWDQENPAVTRLKKAGMILIGKTAVCEFGHKGVTDSPLHGVTANPLNDQKTCGGSSGGAAVAAALQWGPVHIGNDGGGSLRIPASFCGCYGFKPSYGAVPDNQCDPDIGLVATGVLGKQVEDVAIATSILSENNFMDELDLQSIKGMKIAYAPTMNGFDRQPDVRQAMEQIVLFLKEHGATIEEIEFNQPDLLDCIMTLWTVDIVRTVEKVGMDQLPLMEESIQKWMGWAEELTPDSLSKAKKQQAEIIQSMEDMIKDYDLMVMPTMPLTAFDVGRNSPKEKEAMNLGHWWTPFTAPFNLTGWAAASIPCGLDRSQLPIGCQIIGRNGQDKAVLQLSKYIEKYH